MEQMTTLTGVHAPNADALVRAVDHLVEVAAIAAIVLVAAAWLGFATTRSTA